MDPQEKDWFMWGPSASVIRDKKDKQIDQERLERQELLRGRSIK